MYRFYPRPRTKNPRWKKIYAWRGAETFSLLSTATPTIMWLLILIFALTDPPSQTGSVVTNMVYIAALFHVDIFLMLTLFFIFVLYLSFSKRRNKFVAASIAAWRKSWIMHLAYLIFIGFLLQFLEIMSAGIEMMLSGGRFPGRAGIFIIAIMSILPLLSMALNAIIVSMVPYCWHSFVRRRHVRSVGQ